MWMLQFVYSQDFSLLLLTHTYITVSHTTRSSLVSHKGECGKLCTGLKRPVTLYKLLILKLCLPYVFTSKNRTAYLSCSYSTQWMLEHCVLGSQHVFVHKQHSLQIFTPVCGWSHGFFSLSLLWCVQAQTKREKTCPVFAFASALPLSLVINHNLFAWMLPRCSGSLSTVCPCVPSGVCILSEDYGFVSVAYFYAKQIFPHRVCAWENGDKSQGESGTGR